MDSGCNCNKDTMSANVYSLCMKVCNEKKKNNKSGSSCNTFCDK